jgi:hypothetical protein
LPVRIYELAREFDLSNKEVLEVCRKAGLDVKSHSSIIEEYEAEMVRRQLSGLAGHEFDAEEAPAATAAPAAPAPSAEGGRVMSKEPADLHANLTEDQAWEEVLVTLRAELTVEQAWEVALATVAIWVAIRALEAAKASEKDAEHAEETARAIMELQETVRETENLVIEAAKRAIDAAGTRSVPLPPMNAKGPVVGNRLLLAMKANEPAVQVILLDVGAGKMVLAVHWHAECAIGFFNAAGERIPGP